MGAEAERRVVARLRYTTAAKTDLDSSFRYADDSLEVVNVVEGHRDVEALFANRYDD
jgi:hypothetical protein